MSDAAKLANVRRELAMLEDVVSEKLPTSAELDTLVASLQAINEALWDIEDDIRICERDGNFGPKFIELARAVYVTNDKRAAVKKDINLFLGSALVEEKSYEEHGAG
ncbi:hypothetical protein L1065_08195 [Nereida sp. MMG024]|nr:hypothetical protein [Nereida sp. MMG025]